MNNRKAIPMKYPPVLQILVAAAIAWGFARFIPLWGFGGGYVSLAIWICAILGFGFLAVALNIFRVHKTTFDPLDPSKAQNLVVTGIYRITRNPMYVGLALLLVAWCLYLGDLVTFATVPLFIIVMNELQIKGEERALSQKFGKEYETYKRRVRRWL